MTKDFTPSFTNLDRDIERYAERHCEQGEIMGTPAVFGYDEAVDSVFAAYLEAEAFEPIIHYLLTQHTYEWGLNEKFLQVSAIFQGKRHIARLTRLWRAAIATQKHFFWENLAHRDLPNMQQTITETKAQALDTMEQFAAILEDLRAEPALGRLQGEIEDLRAERRPKPLGKPDPRSMTEDLFWGIIDSAEGATPDERITVITEKLVRFKATQIKAFDRLLWQAMDAANHYDLWALAYLAQDGCSDDAFEAFRAWLIVQGRAAYDLALSDPVEFVGSVPITANNVAEALLQAPAIAHEWRADKALKAAKRPLGKVKGEPWEEGDIPAHYPDLVRQIALTRTG